MCLAWREDGWCSASKGCKLSSMGHSKLLRIGLCIALSVALASAAELVYPRSIAVDEKGNIYIADSEACTILRLDAVGGLSGFPCTPWPARCISHGHH